MDRARWILKCKDNLKETRKQTCAHFHSKLSPQQAGRAILLQYTDPFSHEKCTNSCPQKNVHTYTSESRSSYGYYVWYDFLVWLIMASAFPVASGHHLGLLTNHLPFGPSPELPKEAECEAPRCVSRCQAHWGLGRREQGRKPWGRLTALQPCLAGGRKGEQRHVQGDRRTKALQRTGAPDL